MFQLNQIRINGYPISETQHFTTPRPVPPIPTHSNLLSPRLPVSDFGSPLSLEVYAILNPGDRPESSPQMSASYNDIQIAKVPAATSKTTLLSRSLSRIGFRVTPAPDREDGWNRKLQRRISGRRMRPR